MVALARQTEFGGMPPRTRNTQTGGEEGWRAERFLDDDSRIGRSNMRCISTHRSGDDRQTVYDRLEDDRSGRIIARRVQQKVRGRHEFGDMLVMTKPSD